MGIVVLVGVFFIRNFFKIVDVELTNKGREVGMLEVLRKYFLGKPRRIPYCERLPLGAPSDILLPLVLNLIKNVH
jgi:hypothetical protein